MRRVLEIEVEYDIFILKYRILYHLKVLSIHFLIISVLYKLTSNLRMNRMNFKIFLNITVNIVNFMHHTICY